MTSPPTTDEIAERILELCQQRGPEKSICPSEAARSLASDYVDLDWRCLMEPVRQVAGLLAKAGRIEACQKGRVIDIEQAKGAIRLRIVDKRN
ncbi:MAG: DUF3253 domain-containing protein [Pseudomonadota bacterium]